MHFKVIFLFSWNFIFLTYLNISFKKKAYFYIFIKIIIIFYFFSKKKLYIFRQLNYNFRKIKILLYDKYFKYWLSILIVGFDTSAINKQSRMTW